MHFRNLFKMSLKAAGIIIYRENPSNQFEYLLLKCANKSHWTPPKGHLDMGEDEKVAAIRETEEEAGLRAEDYDLIDGFEHNLEYKAWGKKKTVKYWLARLKNNNAPIRLSPEHTDFAWFNVKSLKEGQYANKTLHDGTKDLLYNSEEFLTNRSA